MDFLKVHGGRLSSGSRSANETLNSKQLVSFPLKNVASPDFHNVYITDIFYKT
jgi:hypothetical protein